MVLTRRANSYIELYQNKSIAVNDPRAAEPYIEIQTYENWELIIVNEGSSDDTSKIAKKFQKKFPEKINFIENLEYL